MVPGGGGAAALRELGRRLRRRPGLPRGAPRRAAAQHLRLLQVPFRSVRKKDHCKSTFPGRRLALFQCLRAERGAQGTHGVGRLPRRQPVPRRGARQALRRLGRLRQRRAAPRLRPRRRHGGGQPVDARASRHLGGLQLRHRARPDLQRGGRRGDQHAARHARLGAGARRGEPDPVHRLSARARRQVPELYAGRPGPAARRRLRRAVRGRRARRVELRERAGEAMNRTIEDFIGNTPLVKLQRLPGKEVFENNNLILAKLEGNNPAGSVKDRPAISMIRGAEARGRIKPGDTLIEPTSGNTGIALAMAAAIRGYRMILIMPEHLSMERRQTMRAFGAEIILTPQKGGMEAARDLAEQMVKEKKGLMLDQFANADNPRAHYEHTGPEIWRDTAGKLTHFVSSMGTTGTIMGCSKFFKEKNAKIQIVGCQPEEGSQIPWIRKLPDAYLPKIYERSRVDRLQYVSQADAEEMARRLAREEGIFAGISSGGAIHVALRISLEVKNSVIVTIVCDRGDRYLTTGVFPD